MKRVAIIGTVGIPSKYGGFETMAQQLIKGLSHKFEFTVYCSSRNYSKEKRLNRFESANLKYLPLQANGIQSVFYDILSMFHALFYADVLVVLGVPGAIFFPIIRLFTNKKIIVSIDGIEWKRKKWGTLASMFLWISEWFAVKFSHIDISDNEAIQNYTAKRYGILSKVIEYGADHTACVLPIEEDYNKFPFLKEDYAIKVCRIEPENNVHVVLEAFASVRGKALVIIGNWNSNQYARNLFKKYSGYSNIHLLDPIYEQRKIDLLRSNAWLYIHGHSAGGTNPSLIEAMYLGLPVIAFNVTYNRTTTEDKAVYFGSVDELNQFIRNVNESRLNNIAGNMKSIAFRRYRWDVICQKYEALFKEVISANEKKKISPFYAEKISKDIYKKLRIEHLRYVSNFYERIN